MAYQGRFHQPAPKKGFGRKSDSQKANGWKVAFFVVFTILILLLGTLLAAVIFGPSIVESYVDSKLGKIIQAEFEERDTTNVDVSALIGNLNETEPGAEPTEPETEPPTTEPDYGESGKIVNIVVVGQDTRAGEESKLADTIILCTLNKETRTLTLTSFLRDSYVKLPDNYRGHTCGWNRINTSYALGYAWFGDAGAMEMLDITLKNNYGVTIDGNVEIDFESFVTIVDMLGGIELELYGDELDKMLWEKANVGFKGEIHEGLNIVNGEVALSYARERHFNNADNDMNRAARQRMIITKIVERCKTMNLMQLNDLLDAVLPNVITNISPEDMKMYIKELLPYVFDLTVVSNQCPTEGSYWGEMVDLPDGAGGVLKIDFNQNKKIMTAICTGEEE